VTENRKRFACFVRVEQSFGTDDCWCCGCSFDSVKSANRRRWHYQSNTNCMLLLLLLLLFLSLSSLWLSSSRIPRCRQSGRIRRKMVGPLLRHSFAPNFLVAYASVQPSRAVYMPVHGLSARSRTRIDVGNLPAQMQIVAPESS